MSNTIYIKMRDPNWPLVKHFVHCMQYMYYIASVVIEYPDKKYIIQEPKVSNWKSAYVNSFLEKLLFVYPNIKFSKNIRLNLSNALRITSIRLIEKKRQHFYEKFLFFSQKAQ